jgi:hypothetical protein
MFWAILTTVAFALAAISLLLNRQARMMTLMPALLACWFGFRC